MTIVESGVTRELRRRVLRPHLDSTEAMPGDDVDDAVHFAVLDDDGQPLSACFLFVEPFPWPSAEDGPPTSGTMWHLRSVATEPVRQGQGLGATLIAAVMDYIARHGGGVLWCNARTPALSFYRRLGLASYGDEHLSGDPPLAHYYMWRVVQACRG